jgi:hypothetical protein
MNTDENGSFRPGIRLLFRSAGSVFWFNSRPQHYQLVAAEPRASRSDPFPSVFIRGQAFLI